MAEVPPLRIGLVRLTDAAPVFVAEERGLFAAEGLAVRLSIEPSWSNVADKLAYRALDVAVMLPPLALAMAVGLRGPATPLLVPMTLSLNGNALTMAAGMAESGKLVRPLGRRLRLAVVHVYSSHNLLLRDWLAAQEIDPDRDVDLLVVPPSDMPEALATGAIDGFCAGAPWGAIAQGAGSGRTLVTSSALWPDHPEKCLAVAGDWAERHPASLQALLRAVTRAARYCDEPNHAEAIAGLLARPEYLGVDAASIRASLPGAPGSEGVDRSTFFARNATVPNPAHAHWFLEKLAYWGYLTQKIDRDAVVRAVYRPDLLPD